MLPCLYKLEFFRILSSLGHSACMNTPFHLSYTFPDNQSLHQTPNENASVTFLVDMPLSDFVANIIVKHFQLIHIGSFNAILVILFVAGCDSFLKIHFNLPACAVKANAIQYRLQTIRTFWQCGIAVSVDSEKIC